LPGEICGRNNVYSAINIIGLSLGLACCMLILLYNIGRSELRPVSPKCRKYIPGYQCKNGPDGKVLSTNGITGMMPGPNFAREVPEIKSFYGFRM
jgi:putative ABC transport system permease protein